MAAPAIDGNPSSVETIDAGGAAGSWRLVQSTTATGKTGEPATPRTTDIERSDPRLTSLMFAMRKARHRSRGRRCRTFSAARAAANHLTNAGTRIPFYWNDYSGAGGRQGDATSLVTGPWRTARELDIKVSDGGVPIDGVVALSDLPKEIQSLNAEWAKNKVFTRSCFEGDNVVGTT